MDQLIVRKERCKQCALCVVQCPNKAISFAEGFNAAGYNHVVVDDEKCVKCGICYTMCPDGVYAIVGDSKTSGRN